MTPAEVAHCLVSLFFAKRCHIGMLPNAYREHAEDAEVLLHVCAQH